MPAATPKKTKKKPVKTTTRKVAAKKTAEGTWGGISDSAVKKATGCDWDTWLKALDYAGCAKKTHKEIAELIYERWPKVGGWWSQMVTVGYEQARGLRATNQSCTGEWQVSSSKTVAVPVKALFQAWSDPKERAGWLKDHGFTVRKATAPKSIRITWVDGKTSVEANFYPKGAVKSYVALQHRKLMDEKHVAKMRAYWSKALDSLKSRLEG
jgi:uncharacterized protein YndB with AHSA1/START domain